MRKMNPQKKKEWLRALRSGKYKQGQGQLCSVGPRGGEKFCCLGVAIDVLCDTWWVFREEKDSYDNTDSFLADGMVGMPSPKMLKCICIDGETASRLAGMNDGIPATWEKPRTFKYIANWIERNL